MKKRPKRTGYLRILFYTAFAAGTLALAIQAACSPGTHRVEVELDADNSGSILAVIGFPALECESEIEVIETAFAGTPAAATFQASGIARTRFLREINGGGDIYQGWELRTSFSDRTEAAPKVEAMQALLIDESVTIEVFPVQPDTTGTQWWIQGSVNTEGLIAPDSTVPCASKMMTMSVTMPAPIRSASGPNQVIDGSTVEWTFDTEGTSDLEAIAFQPAPTNTPTITPTPTDTPAPADTPTSTPRPSPTVGPTATASPPETNGGGTGQLIGLAAAGIGLVAMLVGGFFILRHFRRPAES